MAKTKKTVPASLEECPCAGHNLDKFVQPAMLSVLAREPLHGYLIVRRLGDMPMFHHRAPDPTGVYRLLKQMEGRGLVVCSWNLSENGPAKKQFEITEQGRQCLEKWAATIREYFGQVAELLKVLDGCTESKVRGCGCGSGKASKVVLGARLKAGLRAKSSGK